VDGSTPHAADYPLAFGQWNVRDDGVECRLPRRTLRITAPGELSAQVLQLCDGRLRWKEVAARLGRSWEPAAVQGFLAGLCAEGALVEAGEALASWTELGQAPGLHVQLAGPEELPRLPGLAHARLLAGRGHGAATTAAMHLQRLLVLRESVRTFANAPVSVAALAAILWAAHGVARPASSAAVGWHRTIASGGNLHGMRWFVFVLRDLPGDAPAGALAAGLHEARFHVEGGASFERRPGDWQDAWRLLVDPRVLRFASALVLPVHDVAVPARKYGNRATIFAHVEAGLSLQNAQLMAVAQGVATILRGDTMAAPALAALDAALPPVGGETRAHWLVMPSLVIGVPPQAGEVQAASGAQYFDITHAPLPRCDQAAPSFAFVVSCREDPSIAGLGRSGDPVLALRKAEAEAWERLGWRTLGPHVRGAAADVPGALDPHRFWAHADRQYAQAGFGLRPFSPQRDYLWRAGLHAESGKAVHVPAECLHPVAALPAWARRQACANASTSGVAAWTDAEGALSRATLELLERDAFLRGWLARAAAPLVRTESLPDTARRRIADLQAAGLRVAVAQIGAGWVPVYAVFAQRLQPPFTAITAAADYVPEVALHKALDEAEGRVAHAAQMPAAPLARASAVRSPLDIHRCYQAQRFFRRSDFYADAAPSLRFCGAWPGAAKAWPALRARLAQAGHALYAFDLTPPGAALDQGRTPLHVVRALATGLIPIWFQYGMEPAGLPAFRQAAARVARAGPAAFLHPFT